MAKTNSQRRSDGKVLLDKERTGLSDTVRSAVERDLGDQSGLDLQRESATGSVAPTEFRVGRGGNRATGSSVREERDVPRGREGIGRPGRSPLRIPRRARGNRATGSVAPTDSASGERESGDRVSRPYGFRVGREGIGRPGRSPLRIPRRARGNRATGSVAPTKLVRVDDRQIRGRPGRSPLQGLSGIRVLSAGNFRETGRHTMSPLQCLFGMPIAGGVNRGGF